MAEWGGVQSFLQRQRPGKKATGASPVLTWDNLFAFGLKLQGLGNRTGNGRMGCRFRRLQVSRISWPYIFSLNRLILPFWGNKYISTDEFYPWVLFPRTAVKVCVVSEQLMSLCVLGTCIPRIEMLLTSKYLNWFSKGLCWTETQIVLWTSYLARLWQIWRGIDSSRWAGSSESSLAFHYHMVNQSIYLSRHTENVTPSGLHIFTCQNLFTSLVVTLLTSAHLASHPSPFPRRHRLLRPAPALFIFSSLHLINQLIRMLIN